MSRAPVAVRLDAPRRITAGDLIQVGLALEVTAPVEVAEARVDWVCRSAYHARWWTWLPTTGRHGWSQASIKNVKAVRASVPVPELAGRFTAGARPEARAGMGTGDAVPSTVARAANGAARLAGVPPARHDRDHAGSSGETVELAFEFQGPRGTAQTAAYPEGHVAWTMACRWQAGDAQAGTSQPVVLSTPVVPGKRRRWRFWGDERADGAG